MPANFNETLDSVTPNIPTYGSSDPMPGYSAADAFETAAKLFESIGEQKAAEATAASVSGLAEQTMRVRQDLIDGMGVIENEVSKARASLNPTDANSVKQFADRIRMLEMQSRQLRRDNSAQVLALTRQAINRNPHLAEDLIAASKKGEELFSDLYNEADFGVVDKEDPAVTVAREMEKGAMMAGMSMPAFAQVVARAKAVEALKTEAESKRLTGESLVPVGMTQASLLLGQARDSIRINSRAFATADAAEAFAYEVYSKQLNQFDAWIAEQSAKGAIFQQQDIQMMRQMFTSDLNDLVSYATNVQKSAAFARQVKEDPNADIFAARSYFRENPLMSQLIKDDPEKYMKDYYAPMMKVVDSLRGADLTALQAAAKGTGPDAAKARSQLNQLRTFIGLEATKSFDLGTEQGKNLANTYIGISEDIKNGTFNPAEIPPGTVAERLMIAAVYQTNQTDINTQKAQTDAAVLNYTQYVPGSNKIDTRQRLLLQPDFVQYLERTPESAAKVVQLAQADMVKAIGSGEDFIINKDALNAGDWRTGQPIVTAKNKFGPGKTQVSPAIRNRMDVINMNYRLIVRWQGREAGIAWVKSTLGMEGAE